MDTLEEATSFEEVLHNLCTPDHNGAANSHTQRAAVCSALVEVIKEKFPTVTSAALFASSLNALNGTITSSPDSSKSVPQISLLSILEQVIPFASSSSPGLYLNQFQFLSLTLRGIIASIPSPKSSNTDHQHNQSAGWNALLRHCTRVSSIALNGALVLIGDDNGQSTDKKMEKEVVKMFHETIVEHFDDSRAKVRRQAHACAFDLLQLSYHQLNVAKDGSKRGTNSLIPKHLMKYCNHVLSPFLETSKSQKQSIRADSDPEKREKIVRMMHLLAFLRSSITIFPMDDSLALGQNLINLIVLTMKSSCGLDEQNSIMVVNAAMSAILQVFDTTAREDYTISATANAKDFKEDEFCAKAWASLLQANLDMISCTSKESVSHSEAAGECRTSYARCIVAIASRLMSDGSMNGITSRSPVAKALVPKLLPLSFTSITNCLSENDTMDISAQGICAELGRLVRSSLKDYLLESETDEKCITDSVSAMQKLLHYRFRPNWDSSLPCLAAFVVSLVQGLLPPSGASEEIISKIQDSVKPLVLGLVQIHIDMKDKESKSAIEQSTGIIIEGIGIEMFLSIVDISAKQKRGGNTKSMIEEQWILKVLKDSAGSQSCPYRPRLAFFQAYILGLARQCDAASAKANLTAVESSIEKSRVVDLWSLFPSFCNSPSDTELIFPALSQTLVRAMSDERYPQLVFVICTGLKNLAVAASRKREEETLETDDDSNANDERVLSEASIKLLPALFKLVEKISGTMRSQNKEEDEMNEEEDGNAASQKDMSEQSQRVMAVTAAIAAFAKLAPEDFLKGLFKKILQRLLLATQSDEDESEKICTLLQLAQSIVKSAALSDDCITLLYRTIRPMISTDETNPRVQKRAYKVMADMCDNYKSVFIGSPDQLNDMTEFMISSVMSLHVSARHMRLKCMKLLVEGFESNNEIQMSIIPKVLGEVLLCLKDTNGKTREAAYQLLISMGKVRNDFTSYFQAIVGALGAQTSTMRSAAVQALSRMAFEFARVDFTVQSLLPSLLRTVVVLFDENSREVTKSVIGFVRICVAALKKEDLEPLLPEVVGGLMKFNRSRGRFRSKIKIILKILVRNYGYEQIQELVPEGDSRLITHMRKLSERAARRKAEARQNTVHEDDFDDMMESDEEDSDGGRTLMTGATGFTKMTGNTRKSIKSMAKSARSMASTKLSAKSTATSGPRISTQGEKKGEVLDMLDSNAAKSIHYGNEDDNEFSDDDDAEMEFDDDGKLVIHDDMDNHENDNDMESKEDDEELQRGQKRMKVSAYERAKASRQESHMKKNMKKKKESVLGAAYKNKKGGGDAKKKDQEYDPYAYVPLDARSYTKKNRSKSVSQMSTLFNQKSGNKRKR